MTSNTDAGGGVESADELLRRTLSAIENHFIDNDPQDTAEFEVLAEEIEQYFAAPSSGAVAGADIRVAKIEFRDDTVLWLSVPDLYLLEQYCSDGTPMTVTFETMSKQAYEDLPEYEG